MDPLPVFRRFRKLMDAFLRNHQPVTDAKLFPDKFK
jgi:hypothetical protein